MECRFEGTPAFMARPNAFNSSIRFRMDPIRSILDGALDDVNKTIDDITQNMNKVGSELILKAAREAQAFITQLKDDYKDCLDETFDKANESVRKTLDEVDDLVRDIVNQEVDALEHVSDRIEGIIRLLPFNQSWKPFLLETTPRYSALGGDLNQSTDFFVTFTGNFPCVKKGGLYEPKLILETSGNKDSGLSPDAYNERELKFKVTLSNTAARLKTISYLSGILKLRYDTGYMPWSWDNAEYKVLIGLLPSSPGKVRIVYTKNQSVLRKTFTSGLYQVHQNRDWHEYPTVTVLAERNCHVIRGTSTVHWLAHGGQIGCRFVSDANDQVSYVLSSKKGEGTCQILFDESDTIPESDGGEIVEDLRWGITKPFIPPQNEKIHLIIFEAFNGSVFRISPTDRPNNPLLSLRGDATGIEITVKNPNYINSLALETLCNNLEMHEKNELLRILSTRQ